MSVIEPFEALPLPGPLRLRPSFPFVGRPREMAALRSLIPRAENEGRRIALVGGEPGSGKSRLVRELAHEAAHDGVLVLYGACDAVVRTPYRPIVEALDRLVRFSDPETLRADLGSQGGELTRLLPDLAAVVGPLPDPVVADQDTERHRLSAAVSDLLIATSRRRPTLLVIEDGHWADTPTLLLLRHLARSAAEARMLLVATFRDTEADVPAELSETLVDLRRSEGVVRLRLGGLTSGEVGEFVSRTSGAVPESPELADAITGLTHGNAFLMVELWRALVETGALEIEEGIARLTRPLSDLGTPESVREVLTQRLSRLDAVTIEVLELAAVAGSEFELTLLAQAGSFTTETLATALDQSMRSGMTEEVPARTLRYRFEHELIRRALYDRLPALRRAQLHLSVAEALEASGAADSARGLADLAYHFSAAAAVGGTERAIEYNLRAASAAIAAAAFDEAIAPLRTALELGVANEQARAEVQLELGTACYRAGRSLESLAAFRGVAEIAREQHDPTLLARAAIGFENTCWRVAITDEGAIDLCKEALEALGTGDSEERVLLLSSLARGRSFIGEHDEGAVLQREAMEMARRIDFRPGLATVLMRSYWSRGNMGLDEVLEQLDESRAIADDIGDIEVKAEAMEWRVAALMLKGELATAKLDLAVVHEDAARIHQPFILHVAEQYGSAIALSEGRLADAEAAAERSREWSRWLTGRDASAIYGIQMFGLRREQGRLAELAPVVRVLAGGDRKGGAWRPALAAVTAELGMFDDTRHQLDLLRAEGLDRLRSGLWVASLSYIADACSAVGDATTAGMVYEEMRYLTGRTIMIGHGVAFYGAADRYLGMLAAASGDLELAEQHHLQARDLNRSMGAGLWLAHSLYQYAVTLRRQGRGAEPDAERAVIESLQLAERIGMPVLVGRIRSLGSRAVAEPRLPDGLSAREVEILRRVASGMSNREIGAALHISEHTAANHIRSILRKTGCANRTEAASYAHTRGLADPRSTRE